MVYRIFIGSGKAFLSSFVNMWEAVPFFFFLELLPESFLFQLPWDWCWALCISVLWAFHVLTPGQEPCSADSEPSLAWLSAHCSEMRSLIASWEKVRDINCWVFACMELDLVFSCIWLDSVFQVVNNFQREPWNTSFIFFWLPGLLSKSVLLFKFLPLGNF